MSNKHSAQTRLRSSFACLKLFSASSKRWRRSNSFPLVNSACASFSWARGTIHGVETKTRNNNEPEIRVFVLLDHNLRDDMGETLLKAATFYQNHPANLQFIEAFKRGNPTVREGAPYAD